MPAYPEDNFLATVDSPFMAAPTAKRYTMGSRLSTGGRVLTSSGKPVKSRAVLLLGFLPEDWNGPGLPCLPTGAEPGSEAKIHILEMRAAAGQELFHPADPRLPRRRTIAWHLQCLSVSPPDNNEDMES